MGRLLFPAVGAKAEIIFEFFATCTADHPGHLLKLLGSLPLNDGEMIAVISLGADANGEDSVGQG